MKAQHFIIDYTVYPFDLLVFVHESDREVRTLLENKLPKDIHSEIDELFGEYDARTVMFTSGQTVIRFIKIDAGIIAHEALHAVQFLMNKIENYTPCETWNYLLQYIVTQINKNL
jgi:hypothetical protein